MEILPILSTLRRHKTATLLIVLEIALACAILCNAIFVVSQRVARMNDVSGIDEANLVLISSLGLDPAKKADVGVKGDLAALRAVPGVESVANIATFPFTSNSWLTGISLSATQEKPTAQASTFPASETYLKTAGIKVLQGRNFAADEFVDEEYANSESASFPSVLVTQALAQKLFPGQNAVGKSVYGTGRNPSRIVGVTQNILASGGAPGPDESKYWGMFFPVRPTMSWYILRTSPERHAEVLKAGVEALNRIDSGRVINTSKTLQEMRSKYFSRDRAVVWLLIIVSIALLAVTAFGIGGLASFWVQQRTKQIGVRRALGATRTQILRYFQTENFLIVSGGVVLGMTLAFAVNQLLMSKYELARLPWQYLPVGALALWLLGQVAVLWPAMRAASIPPATATRSV